MARYPWPDKPTASSTPNESTLGRRGPGGRKHEPNLTPVCEHLLASLVPSNPFGNDLWQSLYDLGPEENLAHISHM